MDKIITTTIAFVKEKLKHAEGGHDWSHVERVWRNTLLILRTEKADTLICQLAALLHDIADSKFHDGDESIGPRTAVIFLRSQAVEEHIIKEVGSIISNMSFKASFEQVAYRSKEMDIVQDADRLDAIGAIGIARTFHFGGFKNRAIYDPEQKPNLNLDRESYKNSNAPTINHFYEKLLLLKDKMNTASAKQIAEQRHTFMEQFLTQFHAEWEGQR